MPLTEATSRWLAVAILVAGALVPCRADGGDGEILARDPIAIDPSIIPDSVAGEAAERLKPRLEELESKIQVEAITYESDGLKVKGYLAFPEAGDSLPCVIFNRGGNRDFGALTPMTAALRLGRIASHGYVVAASQYRGVDGGEGIEEFGGAELADVLNLFPLLESLPQADASRIGMYGWSRGGMMTYLALARTDRLKAAVIGAGPTDVAELIADRPEMEKHVLAELVPEWQQNRSRAIVERSAILWTDELHPKTPILLLHGSGDWRVVPTQSLRMATALYEAKRPFRLVFFEGGDHGLSEFRDEVDEQVLRWLDRYVRDGEAWPSLEPHGR